MSSFYGIDNQRVRYSNHIPTSTQTGHPRSLGLAFRMSGITMEGIAKALLETFEGDFYRESDRRGILRFEGAFSAVIEMDDMAMAEYEHYRDVGAEQSIRRDEPRKRVIRQVIDQMVETFVPWKVTIFNMPIHQFYQFKSVTGLLRRQGAMGVVEADGHDFTVDLEIHLPDNSTGTLRDYIRAFCCLHSWLRQQELSAYDVAPVEPPAPVPESTLIRLVSSNSETTAGQLLEEKSDRRDLEAAGLKIQAQALGHNSLNHNPKLHYRMALCDIDNPDWDLVDPWSNWLMVESLANSPKLEKVCDLFLHRIMKLFPDLETPWIETVCREVENRAA